MNVSSKEVTEAGAPSGQVKTTMIKVDMSNFHVVF
jgi:hypothetical protein